MTETSFPTSRSQASARAVSRRLEPFLMHTILSSGFTEEELGEIERKLKASKVWAVSEGLFCRKPDDAYLPRLGLNTTTHSWCSPQSQALCFSASSGPASTQVRTRMPSALSTENMSIIRHAELQ